MGLADKLKVRTGTLAVFPRLSRRTTRGHTPIRLDALSDGSVTAAEFFVDFRTKPDIVIVSFSGSCTEDLFVEITKPMFVARDVAITAAFHSSDKFSSGSN
ncbi:hypothetical protein DPMN_081195 [Dreissena polymorpha]|uniref:Uncharacterized protein n=1 Tax=Dreissena polymorpha TaxID=45954 RepID=A0A9D3Y5K6_DREPO|nr:hypothetical protein DPMN_081195 [Dreissena polymorpha]